MHPMSTRPDILRIENLRKVFRSGNADLVLFDNLSFSIPQGEMLAIMGESGAGKSTLLHLLGALDTPNSGSIRFGELELTSLNDDAAAAFRNKELGFVWQFHYLLPEFTALENVAMPLLVRGEAKAAALAKATEWLGHVGLEARVTHRTGELSGGEQQRVALARALITGPKVLMADEPTGNLDLATADRVFELLARLHREHGLTSVIVTHSIDFARRCDRVLKLKAGRVEEVARETLGSGAR